MKEAFDAMAAHPWVTFWLGIVAMGCTLGMAAVIGEIFDHSRKG